MSRYPLAQRPYESLFICPTETPQATVEALIEKIKGIISTEKGTFKSLNVWGRRRLTFPIKRHRDGVYVYFDFDGPSTIPALLNGLYRVSDFVLRHMTVERVDAPVLPTAAPEAGQEKPAEAAPSAAS